MLGVLQDPDHGCCWYNTLFGFTFGPVFRDLTEALQFEKWLRSFDINPLDIADVPSSLEYYWTQFKRATPTRTVPIPTQPYMEGELEQMASTEPWTRLLTATHTVLTLWDDAVPFDAERVMAAMEELAAASAGVDLRQAAIFDKTWLILKQMLEKMNGV